MYLPSTICSSETGAVINGSRVPLERSSASKRMVSTGVKVSRATWNSVVPPKKPSSTLAPPPGEEL